MTAITTYVFESYIEINVLVVFDSCRNNSYRFANNLLLMFLQTILFKSLPLQIERTRRQIRSDPDSGQMPK